MGTLKQIIWMGSSREDISSFPKGAKVIAGEQLMRLQNGLTPTKSRPMQSIGKNVFEIKVRTASGSYRVMYATIMKDSIAVLHCFEKKSQRTSKVDMDIATNRYKELRRR